MSIDLSLNGDFAIVTLNRPERLNALSFDGLAELEGVLGRVATIGARAVLFTGSGDKAFCAGADIESLQGRSLVEQKRGAEFGQAVFEKLSGLPLVSIACINGYAFGGGLELALACTFRVAARKSKMGLPEIKLGLIPGYGGTQRLPRLIGEARALDMILTGRTVGADEAERMGLVDRLADGDCLEAGIAFAQEVAAHSLVTIDLARAAVARAIDTPIHEGLKIEADLSTLAYQTQDAVEGMSAFLEKRKPEFKDA
ncbi:enoyl-CoA hydratase/isomerase family protein [Aminobacter aminovorans]|jgi:enoyl-CoA hydratase|uniref:Enoyl-CoA hydratase n=1 Tax=Aminobacter aminovorans TaxID=83263 RepID=A0AAC8YVI6_AMIAI|nr:enoyl-CoA hydratase-related protein [Aminobacter aminovorans]AMS45281.1 enoyl-CoA hydratase [Aminobacter aminovorans]MBB3704954.1 enoyl-CoA hydratase [Aminobacter aminovorans]